MKKFLVEYSIGEETPRQRAEGDESIMIAMVICHYRKELFIHRIEDETGLIVYDHDSGLIISNWAD